MSRVSNLFRLQEIDLEIDAARVRLAEIDQALRGDPAVQAARARLIAAESELRTARVSAQELEFESASLAAKISDAEQRLYSGRIRNPKELQDLQADIASLKRRRAAVEERQLDALIEAEKADTTAVGDAGGPRLSRGDGRGPLPQPIERRTGDAGGAPPPAGGGARDAARHGR